MLNKLLPVFCAATAATALSAAPAPAQPNIVILIADDLGFGDIGCYGAKASSIPTPNLDRLAAKGLRFTRAYATASICTPSRYSLLTAEYAWRSKKGAAILNGDAALAIDPACPTLASFLKGVGYTTALIGKWHLGMGDGSRPLDFNDELKPGPIEVGFDSAYFIPATVDRVPCVFIDGHRVANLDANDPIAISYGKQRIPGSEPLGSEHPELLKYRANASHSDTIINGISRIGFMSGGYAARWVDEDIAANLTTRATHFIAGAARSGKPFFLYFGTHDPHVPRMPAAQFRGKSGAGIRGDAIMQFDWTAGQVFDALEKAGVADNTLFIITSDNGPVLFDGYFDGAVEANRDHKPAGGLRGWKYARYEGGVRVPFIAVWPGRIAPGGVSDAMVSLIDLFPSAAGIMGLPYPAGAGTDGVDVSDALLGKTKTSRRTALVVQGNGGVLALRDGDWKYIVPNAKKGAKGNVSADYKASGDKRFLDMQVTEEMLFNLADDPAERTNLAAKNPEKLKEMRARLAAIRGEAGK